MMADRGIEQDHGGGVLAGWVLVEALVRPVVVEMALVVAKDGTGVSFVIDQACGVRGGILATSMPSEAKTASKAPVNLPGEFALDGESACGGERRGTRFGGAPYWRSAALLVGFDTRPGNRLSPCR